MFRMKFSDLMAPPRPEAVFEMNLELDIEKGYESSVSAKMAPPSKL